MAVKHKKRYLVTSVNTEMQINSTVRYHSIPMWTNLKPHLLLIGMQNDALKNNMAGCLGGSVG